jgi:hypothetical protein
MDAIPGRVYVSQVENTALGWDEFTVDAHKARVGFSVLLGYGHPFPFALDFAILFEADFMPRRSDRTVLFPLAGTALSNGVDSRAAIEGSIEVNRAT